MQQGIRSHPQIYTGTILISTARFVGTLGLWSWQQERPAFPGESRDGRHLGKPVRADSSRPKFRKLLQGRLDEGIELLTARRVLQEAPELYRAARHHLGGWYGALTELSFDSDAVRKCGASTRRRWTERKLLDAIRALHAEGADLSVTGMKQEGNLDVHATAAERFGGWPNALKRAGLNPSDWRRASSRRWKWSATKVVAEIRRLHQEGADLSVTGMINDHSALYGVASRTYFASWSEALEAAGIDPASVRRGPFKWNRFEIVRALKALGTPVLTPREIKRRNPHLYDAIHSNSAFKSLEKATEAADLELRRDCEDSWSKDRIVARIRDLHAIGAPLHSHAVRNLNGKVHSAAISKRYFGSWKRAIEAAGLDYGEIKDAGRNARVQGRVKWTKESIVEAIRARVGRGESLAPNDVRQSERGLTQAASKPRTFGSWRGGS